MSKRQKSKPAKNKSETHGAPFRPDLACPAGSMGGTPAQHRKEAHHFLGMATTALTAVERAKGCDNAIPLALRASRIIGSLIENLNQPHVVEREIAEETDRVVERLNSALVKKGCLRPRRKVKKRS